MRGSFHRLKRSELCRILQTYARYYNNIRTHRSLDKDAPLSRHRTHQFTPNPWRASSPLCAGLGFRYAHRFKKYFGTRREHVIADRITFTRSYRYEKAAVGSGNPVKRASQTQGAAWKVSVRMLVPRVHLYRGTSSKCSVTARVGEGLTQGEHFVATPIR
jgi:hypothetical protein